MKKFILLTLSVFLLNANTFGETISARLDVMDGRFEWLYANWDRVKETKEPTDKLLTPSWWKNATVEQLQKELQNNSDINKSDFNGNTLLILATVSNAKPEVVEFLIKEGADINIQNGIGNTALIIASANNYEQLVKILLENKADTTIENDKEKTAFAYAFFNRYSNIFDMLFKAGAKIEEINKHIGEDTILTQALLDDKCPPQFIEAILKTDIDPNDSPIDKNPLILTINRDMNWSVVKIVDPGVQVCNSTLCVPYRVERDITDELTQPDFKVDPRISILNMLIKAGADVNKATSIGETPLALATCSKKSPSIIKLLDQAGAKDADALFCAILHKYDDDIIQSLVKPNLKPQKGLDWSLIEAVKQKRITLVKQLIQNGANVNGTDKEGKTALTYAAPTIAKILKENEAFDPMDIFKAIDENDLTKLETLIKAGAKLDIVKELDKNEKMEIKKVFYDIDEVKGLTPLEYAAFTNKPQAVRLLIANGTNIYERINGKKEYKTLFDYVFDADMHEIFAVFLENNERADKDIYLHKALNKKKGAIAKYLSLNRASKQNRNFETNKVYEEDELYCQTPWYCQLNSNGSGINGIRRTYYNVAPYRRKNDTLFRYGFREAEYIYYENGQLKQEIPYVNLKPHGMVKEYYPTGQLKMEMPFKDGKLSGVVKEYDENGQIKLEHIYYENGQKKRTQAYLNGKPALAKEYYENGQVKVEPIFKNGKLEVKEYYENGQVKVEASVEDGELDGMVNEYYENGQKKSEATFQKGNLITKKEFDENGQLKQ